MNRRTVLKTLAAIPLLSRSWTKLSALASGGSAKKLRSRVRPGDAAWPNAAAWDNLKRQVGGELVSVQFPLSSCQASAEGAACQELFKNLKNPFYIGDQPGLTQTLGWVNAWTTKPSVYAVAARNAQDVAAAVNFAREHNLRLVVKGGGHSYQGTSNAADSLLIWTRHLNAITVHDAFVPQGCAGKVAPQPAVSVGSGVIWLHAYDAVTTKAGKYVQGGGCTTVGVAGLIQSGGFGSFSKHYGTAASALLEAEIVTADGQVRIANGCTNPDLFWAIKGGGGGSFGALTRLTLRVRELPELMGGVGLTVKAKSDDAYRRLLRQFVGFYHEQLMNGHWGEQAHVQGDNALDISMVSYALTTDESRKVWQPFLDWVGRTPADFSVEVRYNGAMPARGWWDPEWRSQHKQQVFIADSRAGANPNDVWWTGDGGQVGQYLFAYESLWMPASLLATDSQERLANALFAASRHWDVELHFNKGLAGAPPEAIAATRDTATNPAVLDAFALAIIASGEQPAYPGVRGHEPNTASAKRDTDAVAASMNELRKVAPTAAAYVSESNFFEAGWQQSYWGANYPRLQAVKKKYDPDGLFFVHNGVGSEEWSDDGFTPTKGA